MVKRVLKIIKTIVMIFFIACFAIILIQRIRGNVPTLFKRSIFIVVTDSMTPQYNPGDVIVVKIVDPATINNGDVITYYGREGDLADKIITHKVVKDPYEEDGVWHFQTQGIKKGAVLDPEITEEDVIGVVTYKMVVISFLYNVLTNIYGFIFIVAVPMILFMVLQVMNLKNKVKEAKDAEQMKEIDVNSVENGTLTKEQEDLIVQEYLKSHDIKNKK